MGDKGYSDEVQRALSRPDARKLIRQVDAYAEHFAKGSNDWPIELADDFEEISTSDFDDPDKALAYVVIAASRTDDAEFLRFMGCGPLENLLADPPPALLERIVAEARKSARFRWLLNNPYKAAMSKTAWDAIKAFRTTGPHEEASLKSLPPRSRS